MFVIGKSEPNIVRTHHARYHGAYSGEHMSIESVKAFLKQWDKDPAVMEFSTSCATVDEAAVSVGVERARIAKTLSFYAPADAADNGNVKAVIILVTAGDARIDSRRFKSAFGVKPKMLSPEKVLAATGHAVGGVCPFALENPMAAVYLDESLHRFTTVFPACGSPNSAIELTCGELFDISGAKGWVDVCKAWRESGDA